MEAHCEVNKKPPKSDSRAVFWTGIRLTLLGHCGYLKNTKEETRKEKKYVRCHFYRERKQNERRKGEAK
jgi:hypothetical protein